MVPSLKTDSQSSREVSIVDVSRVYADHIAGRHVIYLDTNLWITLAYASKPSAQATLEACRTARAKRLAIFPISYAALSELIEQSTGAAQTRRCELMDELSEGVSYRSQLAVNMLEVANALHVLADRNPGSVNRAALFSYVIEALGNAIVSFTSEWSDDMITQFIEHCWKSGVVTSLKWYLEHMDLEAWRLEHISSEKEAQSEFENSLRLAIERHKTKDGKPHFNKALLEEYHFFFRNTVLPLLAQIGDMEQLQLGANGIRRVLQGDERLMARVLAAMPSLDAKCRLLAHRILNPTRRYRPEDFWDIEHAAIPWAYSDAFCTLDGGMRDALLVSGASVNTRCTALSGLDEIRSYIEGFI